MQTTVFKCGSAEPWLSFFLDGEPRNLPGMRRSLARKSFRGSNIFKNRYIFPNPKSRMSLKTVTTCRSLKNTKCFHSFCKIVVRVLAPNPGPFDDVMHTPLG
jgi:hypothetical protein